MTSRYISKRIDVTEPSAKVENARVYKINRRRAQFNVEIVMSLSIVAYLNVSGRLVMSNDSRKSRRWAAVAHHIRAHITLERNNKFKVRNSEWRNQHDARERRQEEREREKEMESDEK